MQVICRKTLNFRNTSISEDMNGTTIEIVKEPVSENELIVHPNSNPQTVPDWIGNTELFKRCQKEKTIMEVTVKPGSVIEDTPAPVVAKAGWNAGKATPPVTQ